MRKVLLKAAFAALTATAGLIPFSAQAGGVTCSVTDPIWRSGHNSAQAALISAVDASAAQITTERMLTNEQLISAIRVATRQSSVNVEREANARASTAEAVSQAYIEQRTAEQIRQAHATYGPQGQMVGACDMIASLGQAEAALASRAERAGEVMSSDAIDVQPGNATTPLQAAARRLQFDAPEAVSAAAFFDRSTSSAMRDAYMNNLIGLPFARPESMDSTSDQRQFMRVRRWEALRSPAIASLAAVRAASEAGSGSMSYMEALDYYINQFGGGDGYEEWSAALVTKSEPGLLKEIARLRAINLTLTKYRQEGADRRQAIIASLLAGAAVR